MMTVPAEITIALAATPATPPVAPNDLLTPIILVVLVLGLGVIVTLHIRQRVNRRNAERGTPRERIEELKANALQNRRVDRDALLADSHDTIRSMASQLDAKAERLEQLIAEAERRIVVLRDLVARSSAAPATITSEPPPVAAPDEKLDPLTRDVYRLAGRGMRPVDIARELDEQIGKIELILALRQT